MKTKKKWLYWTIGILLFFILTNLAINWLIRSSLPKIIEEQNDTPYQFEYGNIGFSLLNSSLYVEEINIQPKKNAVNLDLDFTAKVEEIRVVGVNFIKLLTKKDLSAYSIKIKKPKIVYYQSEKTDTVSTPSKLGNIIHVENFQIQNGSFTMMAAGSKKLLSEIKYLDLELSGVNLSQRTIEKNIPFTYSGFQLFSSGIFFQVNPTQELKAKSLKVNDNLFILNGFSLTTAKSISETQNNFPYRMLPRIKAPTVAFTGMDWGFDKLDKFYFEANTLKFDSVDIQIKNLRKPSERRLDSLGHLVPFRLKIDKVLVGQSRLRIEEALDAKDINILIEKIENTVGERLSVENITLNHPDITTYTRSRKVKKAAREAADFIDHITVRNFSVQNATYRVNRLANNQNILQVNGINFTSANIEMTPHTFYEKIPVKYASAAFTATSLDYNPNNVYALKTRNISFDNGDFNLNDFEMKPKISRSQFVKQLKKEKDIYTITAKTVGIREIDFGFQGNDLYFKTPEIQVRSANANIYRSKVPPDDPKKKRLYSKMLRELPIIIEVKHLDLKDSKIEYEEETETSKGAGKLTFSGFNASVENIYSGRQKTKVPDLVANIKTNFMNDSKLNAVWRFNPMNRTDKFSIKGNIYSFNAAKMTPFIKPYLHASTEGNIQEVRFHFNGNDINAAGTFGIKYDNLKLTAYNSNNNKERKILSTVGNILVKSGTHGKFKEEKIETVTRKQDRSFFNFFWLCIQQGLKQSLLII